MDSDKSDEDEHEAISKQIVEYYKKYSLSQQLPKYFSGTPLSYMPKIVKDEELSKPTIIIEDTSTTALTPKQSEYCQTDIEETAEPKAVSPASSAASIRKLEWDSGADIGYNNCHKSTKLHKSFSLPTLTTSDQKIAKKETKIKLSSHIVNVTSYSTSASDQIPSKAPQSSSSSPCYNVEAPLASSSSSSSAKPPSAKPLSSSSSSGTRPPSGKPSSSSSSSFANTLAYLKGKIGTPDAESTPKGIIDYKSSKETPFVPMIYKKIPNKVIELCVTKPISIECTNGKRKKALDKRVQTSFVEKCSKSVQTGDDTIDQSDSKKKIPKENQSVIIINYDNGIEKKTCSSNTQTDSELISPPGDDRQNNLRRTDAQSNLATSTTDSSKEIPPLGQLISRKQSKNLICDIDRSIDLLQKLLKSKKYDSATKKRYIKKIVEKIVDNKYNDDSTTSSELFKPKKQEEKTQQKLQENIPWYPPKISKFAVKTFNDEFVPEQKSKKKSMFTVSEACYTPTSCPDSYSSLEKQPNTTSGSYQSWKEEKTLSERLFEQKQNGEGDHLVKFALKERQNQVEWIKDEISHLVKLKELLEQKNQVHTTTTVYMVSQEYEKDDSCPCPGNGRNYVIQTELSNESDKANNGQLNLEGEIEVFSDEQLTSINVKAKKIENRSRKPTLVGTGKYDTYPRSKQEEQKCWPCGMIQSRKEGMENTQRFSVDVALSEEAAAILNKVDEIVNKYGSKSSLASSKTGSQDSRRLCQCLCKCSQMKNSTVSTKEAFDKDIQCTISDNNSCKNVSTSTTQLEEVFERKISIASEKSVGAEAVPPLPEELKESAPPRGSIASSKATTEISSTIESVDTSSSSTSSGSVHSCICCKKKNVTAKNLYDLKKKLSEEAYPLCRRCYRQNQRCAYSHNTYTNPGHVCACYTMVKTNTLDAIKKTIGDLEDLDYCGCVDVDNGSNSSCCQYCKKKLNKTSKNKNGIAYLVTFENGTPYIEEQKRAPLEEIKIKIPAVRKKKHKDKENKRRKNSRTSDREEERPSTAYSLQEYLNKNRPDFVETAEERRKTVHNTKSRREEIGDLNKLKFFENYQKDKEKNSKRLFSEKEMKEITRRNYRKLPEVQQRVIDNKRRQIRLANRLIADTFNRKLREKVLKGKRSLPTDVHIVNL